MDAYFYLALGLFTFHQAWKGALRNPPPSLPALVPTCHYAMPGYSLGQSIE